MKASKKRNSPNLREPFSGHAQRVQHSLACKKIQYSRFMVWLMIGVVTRSTESDGRTDATASLD